MNEFDDPHYLRNAIRRRSKLSLAVAGAIIVLVVLYLLLASRSYTAVSTVVIDPRKQAVIASDTDVGKQVVGTINPDQSVIETESNIISSRVIAAEVSSKLDLVHNQAFLNPPAGALGSIKQGVKSALRRIFYGPPRAVGDERRVEDQLLRQLTVTRQGQSYALDLAYTSKDPEMAARVVNAFAQSYVEKDVALKNGSATETDSMLGKRLADIRQQLADAEQAELSYRQQHGLVGAIDPSATAVTISGIDQQAAIDRAELADRRARAAAASSNGSAAVLASPIIQNLMKEKADADRQLNDLSTRYGPDHPLVQRAQGDVDNLRRQIDTETRRIASATSSSLDADVRAAQNRASAIGSSLSDARSKLASNNVALAKIAELDRNVTSLRTLYNAYLDRYKQTNAQLGIATPDARVVTNAVAPQVPSSPRIPLVMAIGLMLAIFCGLGAGVLAELAMLIRYRSAGEQRLPAA